MTIIYRVSDNGYSKIKPFYINNSNCLRNAIKHFDPFLNNFLVIADNVGLRTQNMIETYIGLSQIKYVSIGHGAGTFNLALDYALTLPDNEIVYFLENDYLHREGSLEVLKEGLNLGASFVSLYNHPDKYLSPQNGGNPEVDIDGGYLTKLYRGETEIFAIFNSTTMTFAAKVSTLKRVEHILRKHTQGTYPEDFKMFLELRNIGEILLCPINSYSSHGETQWLGILPGIKKENLEKEWQSVL